MCRVTTDFFGRSTLKYDYPELSALACTGDRPEGQRLRPLQGREEIRENDTQGGIDVRNLGGNRLDRVATDGLRIGSGLEDGWYLSVSMTLSLRVFAVDAGVAVSVDDALALGDVVVGDNGRVVD